jgi:hypothetical protein
MAPTRRSVREYLDTLDDAAWARPVRSNRSSSLDRIRPRNGPARKGHAFFAYSTNYLIDLDHAVIVDVEPSRAIRQAEVGATRTMIERTEERFGLYPERLAADTAYGSADNLAWLVHERGIEPHIPVFDHSDRRTDSFQRSEFRYDHDRDLYICPGARRCIGIDAPIQRRVPSSIRTASCATGPVSGIAEPVHLRSNAAPASLPAKSPARSTKVLVTWRGICRRATPMSHPGASERRSRCCSRISSAS